MQFSAISYRSSQLRRLKQVCVAVLITIGLSACAKPGLEIALDPQLMPEIRSSDLVVFKVQDRPGYSFERSQVQGAGIVGGIINGLSNSRRAEDAKYLGASFDGRFNDEAFDTLLFRQIS
ncbi:MAG: hypothetical protein AAF220_10500, partial [Pseudomonadota bacterium]